MERAVVRDLYDEGVGAVQHHALALGPDAWDRPVCGRWTATDLAGHLVCVAGWYHAWLDRAEEGDRAPAFPEAELPARNAAALAALEPGSGPARIATFAREAQRYADRLDATWDLPYGFPTGTVTVGLHAGIAASEWHLHAWDLSGGTHQPSQPRELFLAAGEGMTTAQGGVIGHLSGAMVPLVARRKPWEQLLRRSGRN